MATIRTEVLLESLACKSAPTFRWIELPFAACDATAGSEDELQAVVVGPVAATATCRSAIRESRFFSNIARRSASGEAPRRTLLELEAFLNDTRGVWENSWIRFPESRLSRARAARVSRPICKFARNGSIARALGRVALSLHPERRAAGCAFRSATR